MERKASYTLTLLGLMILAASWTDGQIFDDDLPPEITECVQTLNEQNNVTGDYMSTTEEIQTTCLQQFMWKFGNIQWSDFNIGEKDRRFINSLIGSLVRQVRQKRQAVEPEEPFIGGYEYPTGRPSGPVWPPFTPTPPPPDKTRPKTGYKVRKEYRRLTDSERNIFHDTLRKLKTAGQYDSFANLHSGTNVLSAHNGPNFPGWHRVYLSLFEEAMRQISPGTGVSLPYWDSTLDFDMQEPANSIIWSAAFLGNGDGFVTTGPFANWTTNSLNLMRNVGGFSTLFSKEIINRILTKCRNSEILTPTAEPDFDFELFHGGPHVWVGGQMAFLNSAAHDPVFFMHHAYVDYVWELFRTRQARICRVNPETDYPTPSNDLHASERTMDGFPAYQNIDGYRNYWTRYWYRYERSPTCSLLQRSCGSPYLRCNVRRNRCVSVERPTRTPLASAPEISAAMVVEVLDVQDTFRRAQAQEAMISSGPRFRAPASEPRTMEARSNTAAARRRRAVGRDATSEIMDKIAETYGPRFRAPPSEGRTADALGVPSLTTNMNDRISVVDPLVAQGRAFEEAEPMPLMPLPTQPEETTPTESIVRQKTSGNTLLPNWSYMPVGIEFTNQQNIATDGISSGSESQWCPEDRFRQFKIRIEANGINYFGSYRTYVNINQRQPTVSALTYVRIASPESLRTVALSAMHSCGKMCQAYCIVPNSNPPSYNPCSGAVTISANDVNAYGLMNKKGPTKTWTEDFRKGNKLRNVGIYFRCSSADPSSWTF